MVLEGVTWFAQKGSKSIRIPKEVIRNPMNQSQSVFEPIANTPLSEIRRPAPKVQESSFEPRMEVHSIPKDEVLEIIASSKGKIIDINPDFSCPGWYGYRYFVTKN
jgi:hypothetical protein